MITPVRRKVAIRKNLPSVGCMSINLDFDKQTNIPKKKYSKPLSMEEVDSIKRDWEELKPNFIHNGCIYELRNSRNEPKWKGVCLSPKSAPIIVPKSKCIIISKNEPILKLMYVLIGRKAYLEENDFNDTAYKDMQAIFEVLNMLKFTQKIILESFTEE